MGGSNPTQTQIVKDKCKNTNACRIEATREYFGNSECPGTDDDEMTLWMVYTCRGGSNKSSIHKPICNPDGGCGANVTQGEMKQLDIPGCGGWAKIECSGGCINIVKVLKLIFTLISFDRSSLRVLRLPQLIRGQGGARRGKEGHTDLPLSHLIL